MKLPCDLSQPAFLMSAPFTVSNAIPNNVWMAENAPPYDLPRAFEQWSALYRALSAEGIVWLLPAAGAFQDRPFVADIAAAMHHAPGKIAVSCLATNGRWGEEAGAVTFLEDMGYEVHESPHPWQGEADLKHLRKDLYIGGHGQRTSLDALTWIVKTFDADIIAVRLDDPKAYHLDASLFVLSDEAVLMAPSLFSRGDVAKIEREAEIIPVPPEHAYDGWTNVVRIGKRILHNPASPESTAAFRAVIEPRGFEVVTLDLDEFDKSGAALSCMVGHLNERNRL